MIKNISIPPSQSFCKEHYFCDYIEILALINNQDIISISDVYDRFKESLDTDTSEQNTQDNENFPDKWMARIQEWFDNIATRAIVFNDFYPFIVKHNNIQLKSNLTKYHKAYILLLLSSSQEYIKKTATLTSDFEKLSLIALKNYLPKTAESYIFGKQSDRYIGTLQNKFTKLAQDLKSSISNNSKFNSNNTGDGGLDLVSWIPFLNDTNYNNIQIFLAQCATGKNWISKQDETNKITNIFHLKAQINHMFFMPYDCRDTDRGFSEEYDIFNGLFFDRIRILYLLTKSIDETMKLISIDQIVNSAIRYEEEIV